MTREGSYRRRPTAPRSPGLQGKLSQHPVARIPRRRAVRAVCGERVPRLVGRRGDGEVAAHAPGRDGRRLEDEPDSPEVVACGGTVLACEDPATCHPESE